MKGKKGGRGWVGENVGGKEGRDEKEWGVERGKRSVQSCTHTEHLLSLCTGHIQSPKVIFKSKIWSLSNIQHIM